MIVRADAVGDAAKQWQQTGWLLLETYCVDCHSADYAEAEVDLTLLRTLEGVRENGELATHAIGMIRFGAMPPEDAELPTTDHRREMSDLWDNLVYRSTCDLRPRPGRTTARRLNRAEYNHAVRDLFGVDLRPADQFPSDDVGGGFDNNADVLSLSPMLMEKYLAAAESVTSQIIVDPATLPNLDQTFAGTALNVIGDTRTGRFGQRYILPDGLAWVDVDIKVRGQYKIDLIASPTEEKFGEVLSTMHYQDGKLAAIFEHKSKDSSGSDQRDSTKLILSPGKNRFFFRTTPELSKDLKDLSKNHADWKVGESRNKRIADLDEKVVKESRLPPTAKLEPEKKIDTDQFRFRIKSVLVVGPSESTREDLPPAQRVVLRKMAYRKGDFVVNAGPAAKECLKPILRKAFRCEVNDDDLAPYVKLVEQMTERGESYHRAMQTALSAVLVSPRFLFRVEVPETDACSQARKRGQTSSTFVQPTSQPTVVFLWSSIPDDSLLKAASRDELRDPKKRLDHVGRMISDSKSGSLGSQFARQWFGLGGLNGRELNDVIASAGVGKLSIDTDDLCRETEELFLYLLRENRPIAELLTADYTFVSADLAKWYGLKRGGDSKADTDDFIKVGGVDPARPGVLGHAGVLTLTSYPTRNSPVQRGKWILENLLGTPPPEAPPGVPGLEETKTASADATLREQLELHRADPGCASCHRVMDSLGFGLEEFDHLGRLRDPKDAARKEATGELPGGRSFRGTRELANLIAKTETRQLAETAVRRMMAFAIGRELRPSDRCFVEAILEATESDQYRVGDLLQGVIESPPFLNHQAELPDKPAEQPDTPNKT